VPGPASRSYGVEVAALAGVPAPVVERARGVLARLETREHAEPYPGPPSPAPAAPSQLSLFGPPDAQLRRELAALDPERLTPLEALAILARLVEQARRGV
jgi:DNA mismatch repair protein MutS